MAPRLNTISTPACWFLVLGVVSNCGGEPLPPVSTGQRSADAPRQAPPETPAAVEPAPPAAGIEQGLAPDLRARGLVAVPAVATEDAPTPADWLVSLHMELVTRGHVRARVKNGATVRTGERIEFHLRVQRTAFVYLVQIFADGSAEVLFPEKGDEAWSSGGTYRIPDDSEQWLAFDRHTGTERIYLVASTAPLRARDPALADLMLRIRRDGRLDASDASAGPNREAEPKPPVAGKPAHTSSGDAKVAPNRGADGGYMGLRTRGLVKVRTEQDPVFDASPADDGVTVIAITFTHVD